MIGVKSTAAARGQTIPPGQLTQIEGQLLDRLIQDQLLLQKATDADRTNGVQKAGLQMNMLLERFGSQEVLERQMKAVSLTVAQAPGSRLSIPALPAYRRACASRGDRRGIRVGGGESDGGGANGEAEIAGRRARRHRTWPRLQCRRPRGHRPPRRREQHCDR